VFAATHTDGTTRGIGTSGEAMVSKPKSIEQHRHQYAHNYLSSVVVRVDFFAPLSIPQTGPPNAIYQRIRRRFPTVESTKQSARVLRLSGEEAKVGQQEIEEWSYFSRARDKAFKLCASFAALEYFKYRSFEDLADDASLVIDVIFDSFADVQVNRLGLRYINKISLDESNPTDWARYLDEKLLAIFGLADKKSTISRAFQIIEFNYGDSAMRFQFGMPNPDYPATVRKKEFILDFDAYGTFMLTKQEITRDLELFHTRISAAFEQVITNVLRRKMNSKHG
jgi:uncharacterized protein (TIGR04255 family)